MENKKEKGQNNKKPQLKVIDYIDDRGIRRRTYTTDKTVETYIYNTYSVIRELPPIEKLTP